MGTSNLLTETRKETNKTPLNEGLLVELFAGLQRDLKPLITLPLVRGDMRENASRSQMVEASIRHEFHPERQGDTEFLDLLAVVRRKALLASIQEGLFLETNYLYGSGTRRVVGHYDGPMGMSVAETEPLKETPYIEVRRLSPKDGARLAIGYPELTVFCQFFRAHHIIF